MHDQSREARQHAAIAAYESATDELQRKRLQALLDHEQSLALSNVLLERQALYLQLREIQRQEAAMRRAERAEIDNLFISMHLDARSAAIVARNVSCKSVAHIRNIARSHIAASVQQSDESFTEHSFVSPEQSDDIQKQRSANLDVDHRHSVNEIIQQHNKADESRSSASVDANADAVDSASETSAAVPNSEIVVQDERISNLVEDQQQVVGLKTLPARPARPSGMAFAAALQMCG